jgi:hypothetical protein
MDLPLYPSEAQIARKVLGPNRLDEWRGMAHILEREGMPTVDPLFGGRYWPAVQAWFDAYNRVSHIRPLRRGLELFDAPDGPETRPEPRKRRPAEQPT